MSRKQKAPAMPMYTKDYDTDENVILMDLAQEGMFNRLLRHQWREGSIPADAPSLAVICRVPLAKFQRVWTGRVASRFEPMEGRADRLVNRKVETVRGEQEAFRAERSESGRRGNEAKRAKRTKDDSSAVRSASGSAAQERAAEGTPAVAVAVPLTTAAAVVPANGAQRPLEGSSERGLSKAFLSPQEHQRTIADGERYLDALMVADPDQDRAWLLRHHSMVKGSGAFIVRLDTAKHEHLVRTVQSLRDAVEKLKRADSGEREGLLTPAEYERRRNA